MRISDWSSDVCSSDLDLGGLPTADGRTVQRGKVFRADGVDRLAGDDLERIRLLGLRTVIDLRSDGEIARGTFPVEQHPVEWYHLPVLRRVWSEDDLVATTDAAEFLRDRYLAMLVHGGDAIAQEIGKAQCRERVGRNV